MVPYMHTCALRPLLALWHMTERRKIVAKKPKPHMIYDEGQAAVVAGSWQAEKTKVPEG